MALDQGTSTITVGTQERTYKVVIDTPRGVDPVITVFRETVRTAQDGTLIGVDAAPLASRSASQIAAKTFTVGDKTYTGAELATVIAAVADAFRLEDIANPQT